MKIENGLHFTDVGKGKVTLVFLHYFGGSSNSWGKVIAELRHVFRCIAIDLPGFGDSQAGLKPLSVKKYAGEVNQLLQGLALKQFIIVGHSMGGKIAMYLASIQPFALTSLVLIAPSPPTPEPINDKERKEMLKAYGNRFALETLLNTVTAQPLANCDMEIAVADHLRTSHTSWNWWIEQGSEENISDHLSGSIVPVIIISGENDPKFSSSYLRQELLRYFPLASFTEIPKAGHLIPIEAHSVLAYSIKMFIESAINKDSIVPL